MADRFKSCTVDGCKENAHHTANGRRGLCCAHYKRWQRNGDPIAGRTPVGDTLRYFNEVVLLYRGDECLIWPYNRSTDGYGRMPVENKPTIVSRIVCAHRHGPPPSLSHEAAHSCGKGHEGCVNQMHLDWKTHTENVADTLIHGTRNRGSRHGIAKLTDADVRAIRGRLVAGETQKSIAADIGVVKQTISDIARRKNWAWLE